MKNTVHCSTVREVEADDGVLIFDDTVQEKPWKDENDLITALRPLQRTHHIEWSEQGTITGWLNGLKFPVRLVTEAETVMHRIYCPSEQNESFLPALKRRNPKPENLIYSSGKYS